MRSVMSVSVCLLLLGTPAAAQPSVPRSTPAVIDEFVGRLSSTDAEDRALAACFLGQKRRRATTAVPSLVRLLPDATPVASLSCNQNDLGAVSIAGGWRSSPGYEAGRALGAIGVAALEPLLLAATSDDPVVRRHATQGLAAIRDVRSAGALATSSARDSDAFVRAEAATGLGRQRDPRAVEALTILATDRDPSVRARAVRSLGVLQASDAIELLTEALSDADVSVRVQAAAALGRARDERGAPAAGGRARRSVGTRPRARRRGAGCHSQRQRRGGAVAVVEGPRSRSPGTHGDCVGTATGPTSDSSVVGSAVRHRCDRTGTSRGRAWAAP